MIVSRNQLFEQMNYMVKITLKAVINFYVVPFIFLNQISMH